MALLKDWTLPYKDLVTSDESKCFIYAVFSDSVAK